MDIIYITRIILGIVFLSTGIYKFKNVNEHFLALKQYKLIPTKWIQVFGYTGMITEVVIGLVLIFGIFVEVAAITSILLLFVFSLVISINIIKGRDTINCGCGGVLGNHTISWAIVIRNCFLILMCLLQIFYNSRIESISYLLLISKYESVNGISLILNSLYAFITIYIYIYLNRILEVNKNIKNLYKGNGVK
ncbi:MauE/DoxX family redox-associated membrane protein (plasmid) [Metabacillus halosaccharovorans]|uniref:MauE/DoxX family redox-associated membrane protein n=1 Tax=Metabacillus halosaccharovorans TaxID=930124 RepID=UPI00203A7D6E|nr:MauE/DoxX family redox-associated membrane protein [Metabacillus halosaccharovorans]MCM3444138.1 DoxX family membrane protein [Metabacillus halosaccharovorans]